jgi:hypothetical protein
MVPPTRFLERELGGRRLEAPSGRGRIDGSEPEPSTVPTPERAALNPLGNVNYLVFTEGTPSLTCADRIRNNKRAAYARIPLRKAAISYETPGLGRLAESVKRIRMPLARPNP